MSGLVPTRSCRPVGTEAEVDFAIPLAEMPRVSREFVGTEGEAKAASCVFARGGPAVADLDVSAAPKLVCQRCLEPMRWPVNVKRAWR